MPVDIKLRRTKFDVQLEKKITDHCNANELMGYKLVSSFLYPEDGGSYEVILIFSKES